MGCNCKNSKKSFIKKIEEKKEIESDFSKITRRRMSSKFKKNKKYGDNMDKFLEEVFEKMKSDKVTILDIFNKKLMDDLDGKTLSGVRQQMRKKYGKEFREVVQEIFRNRRKNIDK